MGAIRGRDPGVVGRGVDRESHRRDETRSGIDNGTPKRRARVAQGNYARGNRSCRRHSAPWLGDAFTAFCARQNTAFDRPGEIAAVLGQRSEDMFRFIGEQFATATFSPAVGTDIRLDRWNCFLASALERGQHGHRSDDRSALHDVARSRNAAAISTPQLSRRSDCGRWSSPSVCQWSYCFLPRTSPRWPACMRSA